MIMGKSDVGSRHAIVVSAVVDSKVSPHNLLESDTNLTMHHNLATIELKWTSWLDMTNFHVWFDWENEADPDEILHEVLHSLSRLLRRCICTENSCSPGAKVSPCATEVQYHNSILDEEMIDHFEGDLKVEWKRAQTAGKAIDKENWKCQLSCPQFGPSSTPLSDL